MPFKKEGRFVFIGIVRCCSARYIILRQSCIEKKYKTQYQEKIFYVIYYVRALEVIYNPFSFLRVLLNRDYILILFYYIQRRINGVLSDLRQFLTSESKNDEKCFLFHLKSFFPSQDI